MTLADYRKKRPEIYAIAFSDPSVIKYSVKLERLQAGLSASNEVALRAAAELNIRQAEVEVLTRTISSLEREYKYRIDRLRKKLENAQALQRATLNQRDMPADDRKAEKMTRISECRLRRDAILLAICNQLATKPGLAKLDTELHFTQGDQDETDQE